MGIVVEAGFRSGVRGVAGPPRRPGAIRRTSTIDITAPPGPLPRLRLEGRARDLLTTSTGEIAVDGATMSAVVDLRTRTLTELTVTPARWQEPLEALLGQPAQSGFRASLARSAPELTGSGRPLALLLDDIPVCVLISGNLHARIIGAGITDGKKSYPPADVCAGWQSGGQLLTLAQQGGGSPLILGPSSGELTDPGDPAGWHDMPPLGEWSMRRARRLDVAAAADGRIRAEAYLRDVRRLGEPACRTVHEYTVTADIDDGGIVREIEAVPHVLPAPECPQAVASVQRLAGRRVADLRELVAAGFVGVSTCTHLNDVLRGVGDTRYLLGHSPVTG